ncbi:4-vinyl reductase [Desulforhopalus vacuolatus]|uniref:V4R domain-containing protein n=1 Tax=Desulforhopalus vacuolatus TaxID=40414 RepID=UPI0019639E24|nr:V4R domain-containing protein [Desulforhopalus vacuolatus]MBM9519422.1 4-vinyl reductase [Desulforhopalus vacuolatus]
MEKVYNFKWDHLGDLSVGRPNLGKETSVMVYRLMQYTFKDVFSKEIGKQKTIELFVKAGALAGKEFCRNVLDISLPFDEFIAELKEKLVAFKIGILRIEEADKKKLQFVLTVSEDLDCSGLPIFGESVCNYDEGFIAGILKEYTGKKFTAKEIDCWATGDRTCRFEVKAIEG